MFYQRHIFIAAFLLFLSSGIFCTQTELKLVHAIFRHGERTTYKYYPNDPNKNVSLYPVGLGMLTNKGKMMEYNLGKFLREEYNALLGKHYVEGLIETRSTDTERTKMSAQLVLAGLFPPSQEQLWNKELPWQPIPVFSKKGPEEDLFHSSLCVKNKLIMEDLPKRPEIQELYVKPYKKLFEYVEKNSGFSVKNVHDLLEFYFIVNTEDDLNMTIPDWVRPIYPEPIHTIASQYYSYANYVPENKITNAGYLLKKILNDSFLAASNSIKMYLYSGHETTLGYMMEALGVLKPHIPPYASVVLFEVHVDENNKSYVKLKYKEGFNSKTAKVLVLPKCEELCPLERFVNIYKSILPMVNMFDACNLDVSKSTLQ